MNMNAGEASGVSRFAYERNLSDKVIRAVRSGQTIKTTSLIALVRADESGNEIEVEGVEAVEAIAPEAEKIEEIESGAEPIREVFSEGFEPLSIESYDSGFLL